MPMPNLLAQFDGPSPPLVMWSARITVDGVRVVLTTGDLKTMLDMREQHTEGAILSHTTGVESNA